MALDLTVPYRQQHYVGEYAGDTAANSAVSGVGWSVSRGMLYYDTDTDEMKVSDGSSWAALSTGGGGGGLITYADVATAEAATGSDNDLCYVVSTETLYRYESAGSAYTDDNFHILSTGDGGNTRWLGVSGRYIYDIYKSFAGTNGTANNTIAIGDGVLSTAVSANSNIVAIGAGAVPVASTGGTESVIIGAEAASQNTYAAIDNVIVGFQAGYKVSSSDRCVLLGSQAGQELAGSACNDNICIGHNAMVAFPGSFARQRNIAIGTETLLGIGNNNNDNVAIGYRSAYTSGAASFNVLVGSQTGYNLGSGDNGNVAIGYEAGYSLSGDFSVCLGYQAGYNETGSNKLYIANSNTTTPLIHGDFSTDVVGINDRMLVGGNAGSITTSAALEISSTTGALLVPRLTTTERGNLTAAAGMIIFNTTDSKFQGYDGSAWQNFH